MEKPYFYINGHDFRVGINAESTSSINLIKNKMFVAGKNYGYTDIQWTNFSGEELDVEIYSRVTDIYQGDHAQPDNGGLYEFYDTPRTPHGVLKYWGQNFVPCIIKTNLHAFESGTYVIDELRQSNPHSDFVTSKIKFIQYEKPTEIVQTYWKSDGIANNPSTHNLTAQSREVSRLGQHTQSCNCTDTTPTEECTATYNTEVEIIQKYLQQWGYFPSYTYSLGSIMVNGKFCYHTTQALRYFQEDRGIEVTGDFNDITRSHFMRKLEGI